MKLHKLFVCVGMLMAAQTSLLATQVQGPSLHVVPKPPVGPKIKVLLEKDVPSVVLEAKGAYRVVRKDSGYVLSSGYGGKRFVAHALPDGLRWGEEYPDIYQISVVPLARNAFIYVNGIQYKGNISIYHVKNNRITVVNEVAIEDYLKSTLSVHCDESLEKEALSAVAISARTEAYRKVVTHANTARPWDITANETSYYGYGVTQRKNGVEEAVDWTRYMILEANKPGGMVPNVQIALNKADELAKKGWDAQKILKSVFPQTKIGSTIEANEVAVR